MTVTILKGDCREVLKTLPDESVHCVVTSPPYFGLRDYGVDGQIGLEETPDAFVSEMVQVFREIRRVMKDDGTLWLNLGDSYAGSGKGGNPPDSPHQKQQTNRGSAEIVRSKRTERGSGRWGGGNLPRFEGIKPKDLIGIPWMTAFALRADGWFLRKDIIWAKSNPMPESVADRPTSAHEYIFLLTKSARYFYDADAIAEDAIYSGLTGQDESGYKDAKKFNGKHAARSARDNFKREGSKREQPIPGQSVGTHRHDRTESSYDIGKRNKRSVWTVATKPFADAHFATFPPALIEPCILAGCPVGGIVLDPFGGAGTTGLVADRHGRNAILIELNEAYATMARNRIKDDSPLFADVPA